MKRARFTEDQTIGVLREHEAGAKTVFDHSTEVTSNAMLARAQENGIPWHFIGKRC